MLGARRDCGLSIGGGGVRLQIVFTFSTAIAGNLIVAPPLPQGLMANAAVVYGGHPCGSRACPRGRRSVHRQDRPSFPSITTIAANAFRKNFVSVGSIPSSHHPIPEGPIMLIHLLTCLALTAVTLSIFSWLVLSEEQPS